MLGEVHRKSCVDGKLSKSCPKTENGAHLQCRHCVANVSVGEGVVLQVHERREQWREQELDAGFLVVDIKLQGREIGFLPLAIQRRLRRQDLR